MYARGSRCQSSFFKCHSRHMCKISEMCVISYQQKVHKGWHAYKQIYIHTYCAHALRHNLDILCAE